jgi:putative transposase
MPTIVFEGSFRDTGMIPSMSSTGNCYDNAMAESFFATFKKGTCVLATFSNEKEEARRIIFEYLEVFYNRVRRHSSLGYKSPVAFEQQQRILA